MADSEDELPPERDVKDFTFKQMRKIRMFEAPDDLLTPRCSLLAVSSKFGLTFVGCPKGLKVIKTETIERINESDEGSMQNVVQRCPSSFVETGHSVQFVGLSGDHFTLSVCYENGNNSVMALFDVPTLKSTNNSNAKFGEITLSSDAGVSLVNLVWNPVVFGLFAVCLSSGSVLVMELTDADVKTRATLPTDVKASAICWSPKGKQLVVGHKDGRLTQYSQTLEVKKEIDCPELFTDDPHLVADVLWVASTLFAVVYSSFEEGDTPKFQLISTPKNEPVSFTNFDDIYYVMSEEREPVFYMRNLSEWNMVVSATSNGLEAAVVGKHGGEAPWEKWSFEEDGRPAMPLTNSNDDTFPMGLEIDLSSTRQIAKGEERLPPAPILMILSTDGVLCPFYMLNQTPNANHTIVRPPEPLALGGQRKSVVSKMSDIPQASGNGSAGKGSLKLDPISVGTSSNLPVGVFSFAKPKQTIPAQSGLAGMTQSAAVGVFSLGSSKQLSGTLSTGPPTSAGPSAFSFASPKPTVSTVSGALSRLTEAPASAFSATGQKPLGLTAFKPPKSQVTDVEATKSLPTPQLVKPTPTSQVQPSLAMGSGASSFQSPALLSNAGAAAKPVAQGLRLGGDMPKVMSSVPSQVTSQGVIAQPKASPAQSAVPIAKPPKITHPASTDTEAPIAVVSTISKPSTVSKPAPALSTVTEPVSTISKPSTVSKPAPALSAVTEPVSTVSKPSSKPVPTLSAVTEPERPQAQREMSTSSRFRLPGQSSDTTVIKQEATKKAVSTSKDNVIEASVSEHIREAISHFNDELARLRDNVKSMHSCALVGDNEELQTLRKATDEIGRTLVAISDATKEQQKDIDEERRKMLESFEMLEDARIRQERKSDPRYVQLLRSRALDPVNTNKMRDIRNLHLYLDKTLREVNLLLDEEWNKENERQRAIQRPALDEIYHTLRINYKIAQDQGARLEKITEEMKNRKLLSTSWQRNSVNTSSTSEVVSSMSGPFAAPKVDLKSPSQRAQAPISPEKQAQLRGMFQKRRSTPVRRSVIAPSTAAKSPTVRSSKPQVPRCSSTPAARPPDSIPERTEENVRFKLPTKEQDDESTAGDTESLLDEGTQFERYQPQGDEQEEEQELEQLSAANNVSSTCHTSILPGGSSLMPDAIAAKKDLLSVVTAKDKSEATKPTSQSVLSDAADSLQARAALEPTASGAFSSVKPPGARSASTTTQPEASKSSGGFCLPGISVSGDNPSSTVSNNDNTSGVKTISTEIPPNIAAGMAAISRASADRPSSSKLDPSASIEPVTLVAYKPQTQGGEQAADQDKENNAAKAIANAALIAATAEAQKPSTKPQCSTEFVFKSTDSRKSGPPVVTFKPPNSISQASQTGFTVAPNVTVFKPAFGPIISSSSTVSTTGVLQQSLTGTEAAIPPGQATVSTVPFGFSTPASGLFAFGFSSATRTLSSAGGDAKTAATTPSTTASASVVDITPSTRVSRNLFASNDVTSPAAPTSQQQDKSKEASVLATTASSSIASATEVTTLAATTAAFSFSAPAPSSGSFFKTVGSSGNTGSAFGPSNIGSGSTSILSALMRSSDAGNSSNLFAGVSTTGATPVSTEPLLLSEATPAKTKDESAKIASAPSSILASPALSKSSTVDSVPAVITVSTLPSTASILSASATTSASTPGSLFAFPSKTSVTSASTTSAPSNLFGLSAGSPCSAFSATKSTSPLFPSINQPYTKPSASTESSSSPFAAAVTTTEGSSSSSASGLFGRTLSTNSAFGPVSTAPSVGFGSLGTPATTSAGGGLFGTSTSTAFAPTSVFATSSVGSPFSSSQPFTSPINRQGNTFSSTPVFGAVSTTAGTVSTFGTSWATPKPAFGQSSFAPTSSAGFDQATSKPTDSALGFGFAGFGLGGQGSSQTNKPNPFGVAQGFSTTPTSQSSLFGGKSAADIFKASESPKPAFGSVPFSQSGFGSQPSVGFSGGSFSSQGGNVLASGFGFGAASSTSSSAGFGSPQAFASPSIGGSVFGGAPSFGSSPSFGGAPTFGSSPQGLFGAMTSRGIFGGGSSGGFGQSSGSPTFGALASQSSVPTFGSLAGQSPTPGFGTIQPQQNSSPSFSSFGGASQGPSGVSFSQWR